MSQRTHIDVGNGQPLCGVKALGAPLTSDEETTAKPCKRCQHKLERLWLAVLRANTYPKLCQAHALLWGVFKR
jgi:hypothetical protein